MNFRRNMPAERAAHDGRIPVSAVVFDYGNVLCHPQTPSDVESMALVSGIAAPRFQELYWKFRLPYDRADLNAEMYWNSVAREGGLTFSREQIAKLILLDSKGWSRQNDAAIQWAKQLRGAGFPLAILSNMPFEISRYLTQHCDWFSCFNHHIFSCDVHRAKPEPAIYTACLEALKLAPEQVLFLDDIAVNIEAASSLGIHALLFDTVEGTSARVKQRFDVPVPSLTDDRGAVGIGT